MLLSHGSHSAHAAALLLHYALHDTRDSRFVLIGPPMRVGL